ncbi:hypothetical protein N9260_00390 [bacterium]|nr:hypothetical protein [bacterium]
MDRHKVMAKMIDGKVYWPPIVLPHPTTYEMRPVGLVLESSYDASSAEDMIEAKLSPELTRYLGQSEYMEVNLPGEPVPNTAMP